MRYGSDVEGYNSLSQNRRSLSASALGRGEKLIFLRHLFLIIYSTKESLILIIKNLNLGYFECIFSSFSSIFPKTITITFGCCPLSILDYLETSEQRQRHLSGTSYISKASAMDRQGTDQFSSRKYNYRSRSDVGSPRRYASQTLLDGARPGPTTPHSRKDALQSLQRELDSLSRSPAGGASGVGGVAAGYNSDTGYLESSLANRSGSSRHRQAYDYGIFY